MPTFISSCDHSLLVDRCLSDNWRFLISTFEGDREQPLSGKVAVHEIWGYAVAFEHESGAASSAKVKTSVPRPLSAERGLIIEWLASFQKAQWGPRSAANKIRTSPYRISLNPLRFFLLCIWQVSSFQCPNCCFLQEWFGISSIPTSNIKANLPWMGESTFPYGAIPARGLQYINIH